MEVEKEFAKHITQQTQWGALPPHIKEYLGNSQDNWKRNVVNHSLRYELPWGSSLVRHIVPDEKRYYIEIVRVGLKNLQLYPHHLSRYLITFLRYTPFKYYHEMLHTMMKEEKSYDVLPNFTAIDVLRMVGVGRNEYIDMMNKCRIQNWIPWRKKKHPILSLLPSQSISELHYWWRVHPVPVPVDELSSCSTEEQKMLEMIGRHSSSANQTILRCGNLDRNVLHSLFRRGLIYCSVPIKNEDFLSVPTLEGFVMNTTTNNVFEGILYQILFVIDSRTTPTQLASLLQIDLALVKRAISLYCRLGLAKRLLLKGLVDINKVPTSNLWDQSWIEWAQSPEGEGAIGVRPNLQFRKQFQRVGFIFDSRLTSFLMMGNLSMGLKSYAVTLFEQGKMCDNHLPAFLNELDHVGESAKDAGMVIEQEGEAQTYFEHAVNLRKTIRAIRGGEDNTPKRELEMIRIESMTHLAPETLNQLLQKNYGALISMTPITTAGPPSIFSPLLPHFGPVLPEINSPWFLLFLYLLLGTGPPCLLIPRGRKLTRFPPIFDDYEEVSLMGMTGERMGGEQGGEPEIIGVGNLLPVVNDALRHTSVLLQAHIQSTESVYIPLPLPRSSKPSSFSPSLDSPTDSSSSVSPTPSPNLLDAPLDSSSISQESSLHLLDSSNPSPAPCPSLLDSDLPLSPSDSPSDLPLSPSNSSGPSSFSSSSGAPSLLASTLDSPTSTPSSDSASPRPSISDICISVTPSVSPARAATPSPTPISSTYEENSKEQQSNQEIKRDQRREELSHLPLLKKLEEFIPFMKYTIGYVQISRSENEQWAVKELSFGFPLFDSDLNLTISERMQTYGLLEPESLKKLQESSVLLANQLIGFIQQLQGVKGEGRDGEESLYLPTHIHVFEKGNLYSLNADDLEMDSY